MPCGYVYVDGSSVGEITDADLKDRRILGEEGFISIVVVVDSVSGQDRRRPGDPRPRLRRGRRGLRGDPAAARAGARRGDRPGHHRQLPAPAGRAPRRRPLGRRQAASPSDDHPGRRLRLNAAPRSAGQPPGCRPCRHLAVSRACEGDEEVTMPAWSALRARSRRRARETGLARWWTAASAPSSPARPWWCSSSALLLVWLTAVSSGTVERYEHALAAAAGRRTPRMLEPGEQPARLRLDQRPVVRAVATPRPAATWSWPNQQLLRHRRRRQLDRVADRPAAGPAALGQRVGRAGRRRPRARHRRAATSGTSFLLQDKVLFDQYGDARDDAAELITAGARRRPAPAGGRASVWSPARSMATGAGHRWSSRCAAVAGCAATSWRRSTPCWTAWRPRPTAATTSRCTPRVPAS